MFGFGRRRTGRDIVEKLHAEVVAASRDPALYAVAGLPDTVEGRFESLVLHLVLVFRRLRRLPPPATDVAQDLVDMAFGYLEVAVRESGVGDLGVGKRMKKIATVFYERSAAYDSALDARDALAVAAEIARHLDVPPPDLLAVARYALAADDGLAGQDLAALFEAVRFPRVEA